MHRVDYWVLCRRKSWNKRCLVLYLRLYNGSASFPYWWCSPGFADSKDKEKEFLVVLLEPYCFFQHLPFFCLLIYVGFFRACLACIRHEVPVTFWKNNAFYNVHLVGCIQHDKDKLVVLELLSAAREVQDLWWIPRGRQITDHAAFYKQVRVRPCVHLSFTNCKRLNNLKIKTYLAFSIVEVVSLGKKGEHMLPSSVLCIRTGPATWYTHVGFYPIRQRKYTSTDC